jgi:hypothetical protein
VELEGGWGVDRLHVKVRDIPMTVLLRCTITKIPPFTSEANPPEIVSLSRKHMVSSRHAWLFVVRGLEIIWTLCDFPAKATATMPSSCKDIRKFYRYCRPKYGG